MVELMEATAKGKRLPSAELEIGHLVASCADDPPVSLKSISELAHVNALSTAAQLTVPEGSLTIVYGDSESGKSGLPKRTTWNSMPVSRESPDGPRSTTIAPI